MMRKNKYFINPLHILSVSSVWHLPLVALYGGVDVLLQQLLGLQVVDTQLPEQLSDLLTLQRIHTAQQRWMNHTHVFIESRQRT